MTRPRASTSGLGGGVAEREAERAAGPGLVGAHGQQHVTGLGHARGARRAGGAGDPVRVEQHEQGVALAAGEGEVRVPWQPVRPRRRAVEHGVGHRGQHLAHQVVPERGQPLGLVGPVLGAHRGRHRERPDRGGIEGAGADIALLAAAVQHGHGGHATGQDQRPDADRAAELVTGDGERVRAAGREVDGQLRGGLHRVGVERHAVLVGHRRELADRLHRADLVVRPHHADHGHLLGGLRDRGPQRVGADQCRRRRPRARRPRRPGPPPASAPSPAPRGARPRWSAPAAGSRRDAVRGAPSTGP